MNGLHTVVRLSGICALLIAVSGCDLAVANPNEPDRERALRNPADIEALVSGTFLLWWQVNHGLGVAAETRPSAAVGALAAMAEEVTASAAHYGIQDIGRRPVSPLLNDAGSSWHPYVEGTWKELYKVISATREGLIALEDPAFKLGADGSGNARLETFARFMIGMAHASLGYAYKEAFILDETVSEADLATLTMQPYAAVMAAGLAHLEEAATLAEANTFTIPPTWIPGPGGSSYTSADLAKVARSYIARFTAGVGRTPAERNAVDWARVLQFANAGVTQPFGVEADGPGGKWKANIRVAVGGIPGGGPGARRVHHSIIGPADQSGAWQTWYAASYTTQRDITVETDDRRIHGAGGPMTPGTRVQWNASAGMVASRGLYYYSLYSDVQHHTYRLTEWGFLQDMTPKELDLLKAEAHIRLGNPQAAADLINLTRVANGQLPPITVDGASGARCVPRRTDGTCGNLLDALKYEKGIELWLYGMGVRLADRRGWGDMTEGLAVHLPAPANELMLAGKSFYSTGGVGGADSAPAPGSH